LEIAILFRGTRKHRFTADKERSPLISEASWKEPRQEDFSRYVIRATARKPLVTNKKAIPIENVVAAN
jgi:hypothetical protein